MKLLSQSEFYSKHAHLYAKARLSSGLLFNDYIEFPALISLLKENGKLHSKRVLDIGCGPGVYTKYLSHEGAFVVALDSSKKMLEIAEEHYRSDPGKGTVVFENRCFNEYCSGSSFDILIGSFMLGYFSNLSLFFIKARTHLKSNGVLIVSTLHPLKTMCSESGELKYFGVEDYATDLNNIAEKTLIKRWTLEQISKASYKAGFLIEKILEPIPIDDIPKELSLNSIKYKRIPSVLIIKFIAS